MTGARSQSLRDLADHVHAKALPGELGDNARLLASSLRLWAAQNLDDPARRSDLADMVQALSDELVQNGSTHNALAVAILILTAPEAP